MMTEILMNIKLTMNKNYCIPDAEYIVKVTEIDKSGFHGRYRLVDEGFNKHIGLFRWENIHHMEKIND